jgi:cytidyltransferase-like protein
MGESIGICSGYFQRFHDGHRKYINECVHKFDHTIVIINNDIQQTNKYKDYKKIHKFAEIEYQIKNEFPMVSIIKSIDYDLTVCATLKMIYLYYENKDNKLYF